MRAERHVTWSSLHTLVCFACCCITTVLVVYFYDRATRDGSNTCVGTPCFRPSHLVLAACCAVVFVASVYLVFRVRRKVASEAAMSVNGNHTAVATRGSGASGIGLRAESD